MVKVTQLEGGPLPPEGFGNGTHEVFLPSGGCWCGEIHNVPQRKGGSKVEKGWEMWVCGWEVVREGLTEKVTLDRVRWLASRGGGAGRVQGSQAAEGAVRPQWAECWSGRWRRWADARPLPWRPLEALRAICPASGWECEARG